MRSSCSCTSTRRRLLAGWSLAAVLLVSAAKTTTPSSQNEPNSYIDRRQPDNKEPRRIQVAPLNTFVVVKDEFDRRREEIESFVFQTLNSFSTNAEENSINGQTSPSRIYTYYDFFTSLRSLSVGGIYGESYHKETNPYTPPASSTNDDGASNHSNTPSDSFVQDPTNRAFYISQSDPHAENSILYAIVNICAFLANAMVESIQYDSCEELNGMGTGGNPSRNGEIVLSELNGVNGRYFPMSNACGQFGRLYHDKQQCHDASSKNDIDMSCPVDATLEIDAATHPKYNHQPGEGNESRYRPPPPFYCGPKKRFNLYSGYWDAYSAEFIRNVAYPSALGKTDVEGCCFWGRGALATKNVCNMGKLNYYMGKRAYLEGRPSRYPNIDFCRTPWIICDTVKVLENGLAYPELKWMVAIHEWIDRVQSHNNVSTNWNYMTQLKLFVDRGAKDFKFIDTVSSLVSRGCDDFYCATQPIPFMEQRKKNFEILINDIFDLPRSLHAVSTSTLSGIEPSYDYQFAEKWIQSKRSKIESNIFLSQNKALNGMPYFSTAYRFDSFISALRTSALYGLAEGKLFFLSNEETGLRALHAGLFNLAAFLGNTMVESINNDSCDEMSVEEGVTGEDSIGSSCGQNGRDYSLETCPAWQSFMACKVDKQMQTEAESPKTYKAPFLLDSIPSPFQCHPRNVSAYNDSPDVAGCCWWGRGALSTKGTCNMGKLNFHLGARAAFDNRPSIYPDINFCTDPSAICSHKNTMEIRWIAAMFEWIDRVQSYYNSTSEWEYLTQIYKFVDGGMTDESFIEAVNNIVARGCHLPPCSSALSIKSDRYLFGFERKQNVFNILKLVFSLPATESLSTDTSPSEPEISNPFVDIPALKQRLPSAKPTFPQTEEAETSPPTSSNDEAITVFPSSPVVSNIVVFDDGGNHAISANVTIFGNKSLVVTDKTELAVEGGNVTAPVDSEWPAIRLSIGSTINATKGVVQGSFADENLDFGGGAGIQLNNGQSSTETAGYGEFYSGIRVLGGRGHIGGDALVVNGFGTVAIIYGGEFIGGAGVKANGYSVKVMNSGKVHIHGGSFFGEMMVQENGIVLLYGCFAQNGTTVSGLFADETDFNATIYGDVNFVSVDEQKCDTIPSVAPTRFSTIFPPLTAHETNGIGRRALSKVLISLNFITLIKLFTSYYNYKH
ncbi:hypothetical protein HJC23_002480 [Cyclotella cryptica]|uniref:Uncharacterized protein n=1 Tax=Cyclotella cryptica TaxID=29204 RepID=A0ABD3PES3_9STRA